MIELNDDGVQQLRLSRIDTGLMIEGLDVLTDPMTGMATIASRPWPHNPWSDHRTMGSGFFQEVIAWDGYRGMRP